MPYNTRRKSLSLPSLGIHVPITQAEKISQAAAHCASHANPNPAAALVTENQAHHKSEQRSKRLKRSHHRGASIRVSPRPTSPPACTRHLPENTPPPSPGPTDHDTKPQTPSRHDGVPSDTEFVDAVLAQLSSTVNKPQPTKELSAALAQRFGYIYQ